METIYLDIMLGGRFYRQLRYEHPSIFKLSLNEVEEFVLNKFPWLSSKDYKIEFSRQELMPA